MGALDDLLDSGGEWPPEEHADRIARQDDHQTLYRNRRDELIQRWSGDLLRYAGRQEDLIPFPSAKIAARTLAAFLFGETPVIGHDDPEVAGALEAMATSQALPSRLLEGAITQAVQGEVYLRPGWDADVSPWAIITPIPGRQVIPTFRFGTLVDAAIVTTWEPDERRGGSRHYHRLIEQHDRGRIRYSLHRGTPDRLGPSIALEDWRPTRNLPPVQATGIDELLVVHSPLGRDAESPHGVSIFDGLEALALAMHRLYSQEQHDAELARKRVAVAESLLHRDATGRPSWDRSIDLLPLTEDALGAVGAEGKPVHPIEFSDDTVQRDRIGGRFRDFLIAAGISPDTLDAQEAGGAAISGTSRRLAQAMTIQTASAAGRYWQDALSRALTLGLFVSRIHLDADVPAILDALPSVELADGLVDDPVELARIISDLDTAEAVSTLQKVKMLHPEWSPDQIGEEVERILEANPPPPPAPPTQAFGTPASGPGLRAVGDE